MKTILKLPDGCGIYKEIDRYFLKRADETVTEIAFSEKVCKLTDIETIWEFRVPYQFLAKASKKSKSKDLSKGDIKASQSSSAWLFRLHGQKFKIIRQGIDRYGGFCYVECVSNSEMNTTPIGVQEVWLSSLWNEQNQMATDVLGFALKPCRILSDDPNERNQVKISEGQELAERGGFLTDEEED